MEEIQQENDRDAYPRAAVQAAQSAITVCQLLEEHPRKTDLRVLEIRVLAGKAAIMFADMAIYMLSSRKDPQSKGRKNSLEAWLAEARDEVVSLDLELKSAQNQGVEP